MAQFGWHGQGSGNGRGDSSYRSDRRYREERSWGSWRWRYGERRDGRSRNDPSGGMGVLHDAASGPEIGVASEEGSLVDSGRTRRAVGGLPRGGVSGEQGRSGIHGRNCRRSFDSGCGNGRVEWMGRVGFVDGRAPPECVGRRMDGRGQIVKMRLKPIHTVFNLFQQRLELAQGEPLGVRVRAGWVHRRVSQRAFPDNVESFLKGAGAGDRGPGCCGLRVGGLRGWQRLFALLRLPRSRPRQRFLWLECAIGPSLIAGEKCGAHTIGDFDRSVALGKSGATESAGDEGEKLFAGEVVRRHVADGGAEGEELAAEGVVGGEGGGEILESCEVAGLDLAALKKVHQVADELIIGDLFRDRGREKRHESLPPEDGGPIDCESLR